MPRTLVTAALPYANGPMHFGHLAGVYLPADVYARTLRMSGEEVLSVCGSDDHGVAITISAEQAGADYAEWVARWNRDLAATLASMGIEYDVFSGTSTSRSHAATSQEFFRRLDANGYLQRRESEQLYCPKDERFLADRYITGTCYVCGHAGARGDECPSCGTWIDPLRLADPACKICGTTPDRRSTTHWYLDLPKLRDEHIGRWITEHPWKSNVAAFIENLLKDVPARAITRDMRWGVPLPSDVAGDAGEGKVLYVWFDAPIGYVSFTKELAEARGDDWERWWKGPDARIVQFIGKDNIPFHCLVFPSMLYGTKDGYALPAEIPANEFYHLAGGKFSTSGGNAFDVAEFLSRHDRDVTRFHLCATMPETADSTFAYDEFVATNNALLAGTLGNLATRVLKFVEKNADGRVPALAAEHEAEMDRVLLAECGPVADPAEHVKAFRFRRAAEALVGNARVANVFVDRLAPWTLRKQDPVRAASALATLCDWLALLARWMAPFMPEKAQALHEMVGLAGPVEAAGQPGLPRAGRWRSLEAGRPIGTPAALFERIEPRSE